jgi:hypothetical protein
VAPTQNGTQVLPGSLVNMTQASVVLPQYYEMRLTYWIDPDTGALLNATEHETLTLRNPQGVPALLLFDANLAMTPASVNGLVALDNSQRSKMTLVTTILPLVTGIVGVILLIVGILMSRRRSEDVEGGASATSSELAAAEPMDADHSAGSSIVPGLDETPHEATAESPAVKQEVAAPEAAQPEAAAPEAAQAKAAAPEAAQAEAAAPAAEEATAEAPAAEAPAAEAPAAEAPAAEAKADTAETSEAKAEAAAPAAEETTAEAPAAGAAPADAQADAPAAPAADTAAPEAAQPEAAEGTPAESPTAEMPAAASAPADAPATTSRRGRRGTHRR